MIYCVICDDEPLVLQSTLQALRLHYKEETCEVALTTDSAQTVLDYAKTASPYTLYFLDLKLDESESPLGLSLCRQVLALDPKAYVVYISAYPQYALSCCQSHAFDFLVKPFTEAQLTACVDAVARDISLRNAGLSLMIAVGSRFIRLDQNKILFFSRQRDYLLCHSLEGDFHWRESFAALEERLEPGFFLRVHKNSIVNIRHIIGVNTAANQLCLSDQSLVTYSRRCEKEVLAALRYAQERGKV